MLGPCPKKVLKPATAKAAKAAKARAAKAAKTTKMMKRKETTTREANGTMMKRMETMTWAAGGKMLIMDQKKATITIITTMTGAAAKEIGSLMTSQKVEWTTKVVISNKMPISTSVTGGDTFDYQVL